MTNSDTILASFLQENHALSKTKAIVCIVEKEEFYSSEKDEWEVFNPTKIEIHITHPFIFDKQLIPEKFNGFDVLSIITEDLPTEFNYKGKEELIPLDIYYAPEKYISFVDNNIEKIRTELNNPALTKEDALNAITGGFEKHIEWCNEVRKSINESTK